MTRRSWSLFQWPGTSCAARWVLPPRMGALGLTSVSPRKTSLSPPSKRAFLDLVSQYLETMKANPGNSGDDKEADSVDLSPKDPGSLWKPHGTLSTIRPINLRPSNPSAPRRHTKFPTIVTATTTQRTVPQWCLPGAMDQNPDVHAKWVGLKVVHVEPADASPVLGVVKKSKEQNQQASFKLLLDDGSTVWLNAKNTAGAAVARQEFDEAQKAVGFPSHVGRHCRRDQGRWRFRSCDVACLML